MCNYSVPRLTRCATGPLSTPDPEQNLPRCPYDVTKFSQTLIMTSYCKTEKQCFTILITLYCRDCGVSSTDAARIYINIYFINISVTQSCLPLRKTFYTCKSTIFFQYRSLYLYFVCSKNLDFLCECF